MVSCSAEPMNVDDEVGASPSAAKPEPETQELLEVRHVDEHASIADVDVGAAFA